MWRKSSNWLGQPKLLNAEGIVVQTVTDISVHVLTNLNLMKSKTVV